MLSRHEDDQRRRYRRHDTVATWRLRGNNDIYVEIYTTWSATRVCLRTVESGLGGHEAGVFRVDEGVENAQPPITKRGRLAVSECTILSDITGVENDFVGEKVNERHDAARHLE